MARLEYIDNTGAKAVLSLDPAEPVTVGRNPSSSIHTTNPSVSRNHGKIYLRDTTWVIKDRGSSNGTFINDDPVEEKELAHGDRVRCGDFVITFFDDGRDVSSSPRPRADVAPEDRSRRTILPGSIGRTSGAIPKQSARETRRPQVTERSRSVPRIEESDPRGQAREDREERTRSGANRSDSRTRQREPEARPGRARVTERGFEPGERERLIRQIKEQAAEIETLSQDYKEHKSMVGELELRLEEFENKATRYEVELDSITEKYVQIKDQLTLSKERLDEAREELADRDDKVFQLEGRVAELDSELESQRDRSSQSQEYVATFKIKLTQKDRQIEDLQRQYDLMEFEYRAAKEEIESLRDIIKTGSGDTATLERKINNLREIITDKENVIAELRLELENKDIEIRQIKMGMGIPDLEDEKRKLLEDYLKKGREVDELRDQMRGIQLDAEESKEQLKEAQAELERKANALADIASHPDFKAKVREAKRLEEQLAEAKQELGEAESRLSEFSAEDRKRLQGELAFFKRKSAAIEEKLSKANERVKSLEDDLQDARTAPAPAPVRTGPTPEELEERVSQVKERLAADLEDVSTIFQQWRSNFALFKTYLKEVDQTIAALASSDRETLPDALRNAITVADPSEAIESVHDLLRVVDTDAKALKKGLGRFKKELTVTTASVRENDG